MTDNNDSKLDFELAAAAHKLVTEMRPIAPGQQVAITADSLSDSRVAEAAAQAVYIVGGMPSVLRYPARPQPCLDPPAPVAAGLPRSDVCIDFAVSYHLYSPAYYAAITAGCIYVCLTGMDADMMVRTIGRVPYKPLQEMAARLYMLSQAAEVIRITAPAGTDLTVRVDKAGDPFWEPPPIEGGYPQMLGGQSGFMAYRNSFEGTLVFDATLWPPAELGVLHQPVCLTVEQGRIIRIEGGHEAWVFQRWLESFDHPAMFQVDHVCYGFNPGVTRPTGRILEDERIFGCVQFGIGPSDFGAPSHTDGVVLNPTVYLDGVPIEEEGRYVHPELIALCREMGVAGY